jgi:L-glyceraldehyde 3-phosphate reductase
MSRGEFLKQEALTPDLLTRLERLNVLAQERGETLAELALAWVLQRPEVTSVIVGASRVEQLADSLKAVSAAPLTAEERGRIEEILH